jgi:hypothetical protein
MKLNHLIPGLVTLTVIMQASLLYKQYCGNSRPMEGNRSVLP